MMCYLHIVHCTPINIFTKHNKKMQNDLHIQLLMLLKNLQNTK